jgi:hypothetical protein
MARSRPGRDWAVTRAATEILHFVQNPGGGRRARRGQGAALRVMAGVTLEHI